MAGLTEAGFIPKRLQDIVDSMNASLQASLGAGINLDSRSPLGQIRDTMANEAAMLWEAAELVYNSQYPNTASGVNLDNVAGITGIKRLEALPSAVDLTFYGDPATVVPAGTRAHVNGNEAAQFQTTADGTVDGTDYSTAFTILFSDAVTSGTWTATFDAGAGGTTGNIAYNASAATVQAAFEALAAVGTGNITVSGNMTDGFTCTYAGTKAGLPNQTIPTVTLSLVPLSVVATITMTEYGGNKVTVPAECVVKGATIAGARSVTVIDTPIVGITNVFNWTDAVLGRDVETDAALRTRRAAELQKTGTATVGGIKSAIQNNVTGVTSVAVYENATDTTDGSGRPPHSIECVVQGGADADLALEIWNSKPAGIQTYGNESYTITDSSGQSQVIYFTRSTPLTIYLDITLTRNTDPAKGELYPATGDDQVLANLLEDALQYVGGEYVVASHVSSVICRVPGIFGVVLKLGTSPAPSGTGNITVALDEIASFDAARITIA